MYESVVCYMSMLAQAVDFSSMNLSDCKFPHRWTTLTGPLRSRGMYDLASMLGQLHICFERCLLKAV